ncbi:MAG TPA: hypothetical protein VGJ57_04125 [Nitrospirales bacterium]|jgi:hypothetical protein
MTVSGVPALNAAPLAAAAGDSKASGCPVLQHPVDKTLSPLVIITESPIPGPKKLREQPTPEQASCAERLREAGKKAIEKKKLVEGIWRYLTAIKVAPAQSEVTYQELANALDRGAYVQPALAAYFKAWKAIEADYDRPDAKLDGVAVLSLAEVRDSIVRLGGQVPVPISDVGRTVIADSTRHLREQYFNTDPLLLPSTPEPAPSP